MKNFMILFTALIAASCNFLGFEQECGTISTAFSESQFLCTKASSEIPDTNRFLLKICDSKGVAVYEGLYGDAPESLPVSPGSYSVDVRSSNFIEPGFSSPCFGDSQIVIVKNGEPASVLLNCSQVNSGIRLNISSDFLTAFPNGSLFLKSSDGSLMYGYNENRIAYFNPGNVSLVLDEREKSSTLMTKSLDAKEILTIDVKVAASSGISDSGFAIQLDTSRNWTNAEITIGEQSGKGSGPDSAYSIAEAREHAGEKEIWVYGYIVGGDLTSSKASFEPPFSSRTNIALGVKSSTDTKSSCLSVQLQKGDIRDALNLVDNPSILGRQVFLKGDLVASYYGIPGIQNLTEYKLN